MFRSRVIRARHGYGRGEYRYFGYPLPSPVATLRSALYPHLVAIANRWQVALGREPAFPPTHAAFIERCHAAGQQRPTPLLLQYGSEDYNCLHQDLYGAQVFPLQVAILLSTPGADFAGGEFVLTEQRPRQQSRVEVVWLNQGDAVVFAVHERPVQGSRGTYRVNMRHGVSRIQRRTTPHPRRHFPRRHLTRPSVVRAREHGEERLPITLEFGLANPTDLQHIQCAHRAQYRHFEQRPVMENDVGRDPLCIRQPFATGAEPLPQRYIGIGHDIVAAFPRRAGFDNVFPQHHGFLATQNGSSILRKA